MFSKNLDRIIEVPMWNRPFNFMQKCMKLRGDF